MSEYDNGLLVVVLGYGCHLNESMVAYLDHVISFVLAHEKVRAVIVTGGYTNEKSAPGVSEAGMMADYLKEQGIKVPIILDETATTTKENLQGIVRIVHERVLEVDREQVVIFCDEARSFKVKVLGRLILGYWPKTNTYDLTQEWRAKIMQIAIATPLDVIASLIPSLEKLKHSRKQRIMRKN